MRTGWRTAMFNEKSTFGEILDYPGMKDFEKFILPLPVEGQDGGVPMAEDMKNLSLKKMTSLITAWNPKSISDGFNAIAENLRKGRKTEYEIYTPEEIAEDPSKERTGIVWFPSGQKGPFAIICAGGAYMNVASISEAFPTAARLSNIGITAFVLQYRAGVKGAAEKSEEDLRRAVTFVMTHSEKFGVEKRYAAFGFSAGGHLVAELGTENEGYKVAGIPAPQMLVLCYPFLSFAQENEQMPKTMNMMFGDQADLNAMKKRFSPMEHLNINYPKTYIWQTVDDDQVPYELNGYEMFIRLQKLGVPSKLKSIQHGEHGLGLGEGTEAEGWLEEAVAFWDKKG